jgi:hypothetical protein
MPLMQLQQNKGEPQKNYSNLTCTLKLTYEPNSFISKVAARKSFVCRISFC